MATKNKQGSEFQVTVRVGGELSIIVSAVSLDDALAKGREFSFADLVSGDYDNLDLTADVIGVYRNS